MKIQLFFLTLGVATLGGAFAACSNATNGDVGEAHVDGSADSEGGGSGSSSGGSGSSSGGGGGSDGSSPVGDSSTGDGGVNTSQVVINEVSGKGSDWVELYNAGTAPLDLSGYALAHSKKDAGPGPDLDNAVTFPSSTTLQPNAYILVAEQADDAGNASVVCPDGGQAYCFGSTWGISNKSGDNIYVLDPQKSIDSQVDYPANTVKSGQTWGRIPNGTGNFQTNLPTPGAANVAN